MLTPTFHTIHCCVQNQSECVSPAQHSPNSTIDQPPHNMETPRAVRGVGSMRRSQQDEVLAPLLSLPATLKEVTNQN